MGFSERWIDWIMLCVSTVSYSVNFNGSQIGPIIPRRGLRQGDPLSPYLFLLCVEGLSCSIKKAAEEGTIKGCKIHANAPAVTHLLFADDSFLFCKATKEEVGEIKGILKKYELNSGQAINFQKSRIYFSANVRLDKQSEVKTQLEVHNDLSEGRYLGLPSLIGQSKKQVFNFLKDRMWRKIQGWGEKCLSKAGKAVLLRNLAQAVPSYAMSCFLMPKSLCKDLERMMNSYWWGSNESSRKGIRWLSWTNMSMSKRAGGLGFRDLHGYNSALLGKQCWNFLNNPTSLVARVFKARYFNNTSLFEASRGGGVSYIWSGMWQAKEALKNGFKWVLGNGENIRIFEDPWIRGKDRFMADNTHTGTSWGMKVRELFIPGEKQWDESKVNSIVTTVDAKAILAIPIPKSQVPDRIAWAFSPDGKYSVKSGYKYWHDRFSDCKHEVSSQGWAKLWKLEVPHKIRVFLWKICRNNIPVRYIMRRKGVQTSIICPMCLNDVEHLLHIFLDCSFAKECWQALNLNFDTLTVESAPDWLLQRLAEDDKERMVQVATILWSIWTTRNMKVWENKVIPPDLIIENSAHQIHQWREMQPRKVVNSSINQQRQSDGDHWVAPEVGKVKINVDASVVLGSGTYSAGVVLRDHHGEFCRARYYRREGDISVLEAEAG